MGILIIEDDKKVSAALAKNLRAESFAVDSKEISCCAIIDYESTKYILGQGDSKPPFILSSK